MNQTCLSTDIHSNHCRDNRSRFLITRLLLSLVILLVIKFGLYAQTTTLSVKVNEPTITISPSLYGIFFEDINHAADGGLYAELVSNRSFEDNINSPTGWTLVQGTGATGQIALDTANMLNKIQLHALKIQATVASANARVGAANSGFWGINVVNNQKYTLTLFAKCTDGFAGKIIASLENSTGTTVYAKDSISGLTTGWNKYSIILTPNGTSSNGRLVISINDIGAVWIDVVSLFPPTYMDRPNGLRPDLAQMLVDLKPKFVRFPGGCFVEGDYMANRFQWKKTIGNIEDRPGHLNLWGYRTSDGMGYHEFLQMTEDVGAEGLYVTNIGIAHKDYTNYTQIDSLIQDALDAIEYANGPVTSTYGAMRAANGHTEPFNIKYIEIGNENNGGDHYAERYMAFFNAIKAKYPDIQCIGNFEALGTDDLIDEHYYSSPQWFIDNAYKYDNYSRAGKKVYVGEYAVTSSCGYGNLIAAIGEAAFMTGMERNSDMVKMCSYAPIFVNVNNRAWNPDMINYNAAQSYGTPSYYVQKLFSNNLGDVYLPYNETNNAVSSQGIKGYVGVGTWSTQSEYDDVMVKAGTTTLFFDDFSSGSSKWTASTGTWAVSSGVYAQTSALTDCRAIATTKISDTSYVYTLKARKTGGNEGFLIIFGYTDSNNFYWWNIGGWNNTQHAIERAVSGSKSIVASVAGSIVTNQWYNVKIEIKTNLILCYLNDVLIHQVQLPDSKILYTSSTKTDTNEIIAKVVNVTNAACKATISMNGVAEGSLLNGTATVLTSAHSTDENSFSNPTLISPVTTTVIDSSLTFNYSFPAYSVTVFNLQYSNPPSAINQKKVSPDNDIKIYPNPLSRKFFTVEFPASEVNKPLVLSVSDMCGHQIFKEDFICSVKNQFSIGDLQNGMYNISIRSDKINKTKIIIVNL